MIATWRRRSALMRIVLRANAARVRAVIHALRLARGSP
jgi:hypothetical protein